MAGFCWCCAAQATAQRPLYPVGTDIGTHHCCADCCRRTYGVWPGYTRDGLLMAGAQPTPPSTGPHVEAIVKRFCQPGSESAFTTGPQGPEHWRYGGFVKHPDPAYGDSADYRWAIDEMGGWTLISDLGCWSDGVVYHLRVAEHALLRNVEGDIAVDIFATHQQLRDYCLALADRDAAAA